MKVKNNEESSIRIDPDWMQTTTLILTAISTLATVTSVGLEAYKNRNSQQGERPFSDATSNMIDACVDIRRSLDAVEELFLADQQRRLASDFQNLPRFGKILAWFSTDDFRDYRRADTRLIRATGSFRQWALHFESAIAQHEHPRELAFFKELEDLQDVINQAFYESETAEAQLRLIRTSLERIERALKGLRRRN